MKLLYTLLLVTFLASCSKTGQKDETIICGFVEIPAWLNEKKDEYVSCVCLTEIRRSIYQDMQVFEIRIIDPLCNGINVVYKLDGTILLTSTNQDAYNKYLSAIKNTEVLWSCSKQATFQG